jgi:hypothetical protein
MEDFLKLIVPDLQSVEPIKTSFYCTFNPSDGSILAISGSPEQMEGMQCIEIAYDDGIAFLTGRENYGDWTAVNIRDQYYIKKLDRRADVKDRVELLTICEYDDEMNKHVDYPDVKLVVDHTDSTLKVHYNGENIQAWKQPLKIFLTKEGDPSHLICSFKLDINTLDRILAENQLTEWPNPVVIQLEDADDLSVFGNRYTHQVRLIHER